MPMNCQFGGAWTTVGKTVRPCALVNTTCQCGNLSRPSQAACAGCSGADDGASWASLAINYLLAAIVAANGKFPGCTMTASAAQELLASRSGQ